MIQVMPDELVVVELMLHRFGRLKTDLQRGTITRNDFQPWKVENLARCHRQSTGVAPAA